MGPACDLGECTSCEADCPAGCVCPHDECATGEPLDLACGECEATICALDPFCCLLAWDSICRTEAEELCGLDCPVVCGDGVCDDDETCDGCPEDCCVEGAAPASR